MIIVVSMSQNDRYLNTISPTKVTLAIGHALCFQLWLLLLLILLIWRPTTTHHLNFFSTILLYPSPQPLQLHLQYISISTALIPFPYCSSSSSLLIYPAWSSKYTHSSLGPECVVYVLVINYIHAAFRLQVNNHHQPVLMLYLHPIHLSNCLQTALMLNGKQDIKISPNWRKHS